MTKKKTKNKPQEKEIERTASSVKVMRILFIVFSIIIVLSMILAATASY